MHLSPGGPSYCFKRQIQQPAHHSPARYSNERRRLKALHFKRFIIGSISREQTVRAQLIEETENGITEWSTTGCNRGPVGSGKTTLTERLCKALRDRYSIAVITNDIYTKEDALILVRKQALSEERIMGVETGGCPHTAIREDASINLQAIAEMNRRIPDLDIVFIESGGDNLAATFSPDLAGLTLYVISVCQGEEIPRKGGPGITRSDFLVINKSDLAPYVNVDLEVMQKDTERMRTGRPFAFTDLIRDKELDTVIDFIVENGGIAN